MTRWLRRRRRRSRLRATGTGSVGDQRLEALQPGLGACAQLLEGLDGGVDVGEGELGLLGAGAGDPAHGGLVVVVGGGAAVDEADLERLVEAQRAREFERRGADQEQVARLEGALVN